MLALRRSARCFAGIQDQPHLRRKVHPADSLSGNHPEFMAKRVRIVWSEGLLLTPQHLSTGTDSRSRCRPFGAAGANAYGMTAIQLDADAIHNGQILLESGAGVTPGGLPFAFPDQDDIPAGRTMGSTCPRA